MPSKNIAELADELDLSLFNSVVRLESLAELTGDEKLLKAANIVSAQRRHVRKHMTADRRAETEST